MTVLRLFCLAITLAALPLAARAAETWPTRPIRLIVPFPAGGPTDQLARAFGQKLGEDVKQPVVIDNRPGGGGLIGNDAVAKAAPDGYTLGLPSGGSMAIMPNLAKLPYDRDRDLTAITIVARVPQILVANAAKVPATDLAALLKLAAAKPGTLNYGSTGNGSPTHLLLERIKQMSGADIVHVPYRGAAPAITDILAGQIELTAADPSGVLQHLQSGALRAIAMSDETRLASLPDIPTFAEAGLPGVVMVNWYVLIAPHGLPADLLAQIHAAALAVLRDPALGVRMAAQGTTLVGTTPEAAAAFVESETRNWGDVARAANVQLD